MSFLCLHERVNNRRGKFIKYKPLSTLSLLSSLVFVLSFSELKASSSIEEDEEEHSAKSSTSAEMEEYSELEINARMRELALESLAKDKMMAYINKNSSISTFFHQFDGVFTDLLLAYKVLRLGLVQRSSTHTDSFLDLLKSSGEKLKVVPLANVITQVAGGVLQNNYDQLLNDRHVNMATYITSLENLISESQKIAFTLAYNYSRQIKKLDEENAAILANCALERVHRFLLTHKPKNIEETDTPFHIQVADGIREVSWPKKLRASEFLKLVTGQKLKLKTKKGTLTTKKGQTWYESYIFCYTGVCYTPSMDVKEMYVLKPKPGKKSWKHQEGFKKYGFRFGNKDPKDHRTDETYSQLTHDDKQKLSSVLDNLLTQELLGGAYYTASSKDVKTIVQIEEERIEGDAEAEKKAETFETEVKEIKKALEE